MIGGHSFRTPFLWLRQKNLHAVSCMCFQFCRPCQSHNVTILYNASWREEETCSSYLQRGPWYQWYDVIAEACSNTLLQQNIDSDLGSKFQGYYPAHAIHKLMELFTTYGGYSPLSLSFSKVYFWREEGGREGQLRNCLLCEGWWQLGYIPHAEVRWGSIIQN